MLLFAALLALALTGWSLYGNLVLGERAYTTRNVVLTAVLLGVATAVGLPLEELGLAAGALGTGLQWGLAAAGVVVAVLATALGLSWHVRAIGKLLDDQRGDLPPRELLRHAIVRIPLGTAVFEEVAFRGVLLGAVLTVAGPTVAVTLTSVVFGLWHVAPTAVALRINGVDPRSRAGVRAVVAGVAVTTVGGVLFCLLRLGSGSLLAPVLAHVATNVGSLAAAAIRRRARSRTRGSRART